MNQHTPGPWDLQNKGDLYSPSGRVEIVGGVKVEGRRNLPTVIRMKDLSDRSYADARRIVACVNGCAGINPEAVPELLVAADLAVHVYQISDREQFKAHFGPIVDKLQAAIAKAEKVTP